ncbi:MAG: Fur family transcriptional regulator [Desulfuromonadaceae bacterium]
MLIDCKQTDCTITKIFSDFVAAKGLNMSRQRTLVLEAFLSAEQQNNVEDLFIVLREKHPAFGRSTVYRTMKLMVECGIVRVITVDGASRIEKCQEAEDKQPLYNRNTATESVPADQDG